MPIKHANRYVTAGTIPLEEPEAHIYISEHAQTHTGAFIVHIWIKLRSGTASNVWGDRPGHVYAGL